MEIQRCGEMEKKYPDLSWRMVGERLETVMWSLFWFGLETMLQGQGLVTDHCI